MNEMRSINWINAVKAICIILVFLRHSENYYGFNLGIVDPLYLTIYVNAFFFISGYLLFWKQLSEPKILEDRRAYVRMGGGRVLISNVLYRIAVPSVLFSIIEFAPSCLIQGRSIDLGYAFWKTIGGGTYWFTSALVVAELILLMLFCTRKRNICFYFVICLILGLVGLSIVKLGVLRNNVWMWRHGLLALVFLALGGLYWKYEKQVDKLMHWWFAIPLVVVYVAMIIGLKDYADALISTLTIQPLGYVTSAIACLLLVWLCKKLPEVKPITFIGQNSLGFYFMSGALPIVFSMIAHKMLPESSILMLFAIWITCLAVAYIAVIFINRWLPWLWDLRRLRKQNG